MKKLILVLGFIVGCGALAHAAQPVELLGSNPESKYGYTNGTVAISSVNTSTIAAVGYGYRQITLTSSVSFYYRLDGSTQTIATTGYPGLANTDVVIESSDPIYILSGTGVGGVTARYIEKRK